MSSKDDNSATGAAYQIEGLLKIDKIVIAVPLTAFTAEIWNLHRVRIFQAIKGLLKNHRDHDGYCKMDRWFSRRRELSNDAHLIEIFYERRPVKKGNGSYFSYYQAYIRVTNRDFHNGYAEHVEIAMQIEMILDYFALPHHLGTGKECCELALDFPSYETWKFVDERLLWRWTSTQDHGYYDLTTRKVLPGFDPLKNAGAESHYVKRPRAQRTKSRRYTHGYIKADTGKYRQEMRLNVSFLKDHEIVIVAHLAEKGKSLLERHLSLWEPDINKILRQRQKYANKRQCAEFYRRTPNFYRKLVEEHSTAEVLDNLGQKLKHLSSYEIKEKCFKRIEGLVISEALLKKHPTIPKIDSIRNSKSSENGYRNVTYDPPIFMHETPAPAHREKKEKAETTIFPYDESHFLALKSQSDKEKPREKPPRPRIRF